MRLVLILAAAPLCAAAPANAVSGASARAPEAPACCNRAVALCEHPFGGARLDRRGQVTKLGGRSTRSER